jgi:hypothetical protein
MEVGQGPNWGCSAKEKKKENIFTICIIFGIGIAQSV